MTVEAQVMAWGVAVCAPLAFNIAMRRDSDALGLSGMLLLIWLLGRILWALYSPPECMRLYPLIDAVAGTVCFMAWRARPGVWKLVLMGLFMLQCALHAAFWLSGPAEGALLTYIRLNNLLFIGQLITTSGPGAAHAWTLASGRFRARMPGVLRRARHQGPPR